MNKCLEAVKGFWHKYFKDLLSLTEHPDIPMEETGGDKVQKDKECGAASQEDRVEVCKEEVRKCGGQE